MYASVSVQINSLVHFLASFVGLFGILPIFIFHGGDGNWVDRRVRTFIKMTFFVIVSGYVLVALKLFEVIAYATLFVVLLALHSLRRPSQREGALIRLSTPLFDYLDERETLVHRRTSTRHQLRSWIHRIRRSRFRWHRVLPFLLTLAVLGVASYIRFADSVVHAAPAMSDSYVTLAWMKYANERILFHDGIYPQGFHIVLALLGKFAFINSLYILRYMGPLDSLLIALSIFYVVSRFRGGLQGAIVGLVLYGLLGSLWLGDDWARQAATNSQEFAFIFVLPTLYFLYRYVKEGDREDWRTALAGASVIGLVHTVAFLLLVLGALAIFAAALVSDFTEMIVRVGWGLVAGILSGIISVLPLGLGLLMGKQMNSSAMSYATSVTTGTVAFPALHLGDYLGLAAIVLLLGQALIQSLHRHYQTEVLFSAFFGLFVFLLYFAGGPLTKSGVLDTRTLDLWGITAPFVIGVAWMSVSQRLAHGRWGNWVPMVLSTVIVLGAIAWQRPAVIHPYKMQWDEEVDGLLRINRAYGPLNWMLVSPELDYAMVLGSGYRMDVQQLIANYDPTATPLTKRGQNSPDKGIPPDVFVLVQKQIFEVNKTNAIFTLEQPVYAQEAQDQAALDQWLAQFRADHTLSTFYDGQNVIIYHIHSNY